MNLKPLFEMQQKLDDRIIEEKGLEGQDLLPEKILALQVELGELANEWRGFKFWSEDREPRTKVGLTSFYAAREGKTRNPLLEEYVDCLHFILSIGLEIGVSEINLDYRINMFECIDVTRQFSSLFEQIASFNLERYSGKGVYYRIFNIFAKLGEMLRFTRKQIEQAYKEKNATNHLRQSNGY